MIVLGIETATDVCGAALVQDGEVIALREVHRRHIHAEQLPGLAGAVLAGARKDIGDLDAVAVSTGPGSFTGLRIGLSAAKGIAFAREIPLVGVPTLEALALRSAAGATGSWILAVLDARRDDVYAQLFCAGEGGVEPAGEVRDLNMAGVTEYLGDRPVLITGDAAEKVAASLAEAGATCTLAPAPLRTCSAAAVGILGERMARAGRRSDPRTLEPLYIKEFFLKAR